MNPGVVRAMMTTQLSFCTRDCHDIVGRRPSSCFPRWLCTPTQRLITYDDETMELLKLETFVADLAAGNASRGRASLSLSADIHLNTLKDTYDWSITAVS
jgi:hypothetical protein